jgi:hypothetical protein
MTRNKKTGSAKLPANYLETNDYLVHVKKAAAISVYSLGCFSNSALLLHLAGFVDFICFDHTLTGFFDINLCVSARCT